MDVTATVLAYGSVVLFGALIGLSEIVARYRDDPGKALLTLPAVLYISLNALVAAAVLYLARLFGWTFGYAEPNDMAKAATLQVLVCGCTAMAVLRSSLFTVRIGSQDVGIGLSTAVLAVLHAVDAAVDRERGTARDLAVRVMDGLSFDKAKATLPAYCINLLQNLSDADQTAFARNVESIVKMDANNTAKCRMLGLAICNVMGPDVLKAAVESLRGELGP